MQRQGQILAILLIVQILLVVILIATEKESGTYRSNEKLLKMPFDSVEKIVIQGAENKSLVLEKQKDGWILPAYFEFPASKEKLDRIFGGLFDLTVGWPVATTESAEKRFKVATDEFERKLVFTATKAEKTLFLGTSPGFKKIHARVEGNNTIYGIKFSAYQASNKAIDWADQSLLHIPREDINTIEISDLTIRREQGKFVIDGLDDGEQAVDPEIQLLLSQVSSLGFQDVLGKKNDPAYGLDSPLFELVLVDKAGQRLIYRYAKLKDSEDYVLKPSNSDYYFQVAKHSVESLQGFDRNKLVKIAAIEQEAEEEDTSTVANEPQPE